MDENNDVASAEQLFAKKAPRRYKVLTLPASGHKVRIQSLTEREMSRYQTLTMMADKREERRARLEDATRRLIGLCLVDQAGNRILSKSHQAQLADWDSLDTSFLFERMTTHCGLTAADIEGLVKNSEEMPDDSPLLASPSE